MVYASLHKYAYREQRYLAGMVDYLFTTNCNPPVTILHNARKIVNIINPITGSPLEIDIYIPRLKLGFEYQDQHHYISTWYANDTLEGYQLRDNIKLTEMNQRGLTLIIIPCWWDHKIDSLVATIKHYRSDLLLNYPISCTSPIPQSPPSHFFETLWKVVPGVGELASPSFATALLDPIE